MSKSKYETLRLELTEEEWSQLAEECDRYNDAEDLRSQDGSPAAIFEYLDDFVRWKLFDTFECRH
jgi:hypothetical protein